jgi:ABC-type nitrate/sulfonate/bicarbonate transport system substrate-binding protein
MFASRLTRMTFRRLWKIGSVLASLFVLAEIGGNDFATAAQSSVKVTASYGGELGYQAPLWVAHDLNLFAKQGINAELVRIAGGTRSMSALLANATQVSQSAGVSLVQANVAGGDLVMVATSTNRPTVSIVTQPKTVKRPQDLAGKSVGLEGGRGGMDEFLFLSVLDRWGIDPKSITYLAISGSHSRVLAVAGGNIDVTIIAPPFTFEAEKLHLTTLADLTTSAEPFPQSGLMVRKEYLRGNRDTVKRILMAYAEAIHVLKTDAEKSVAIMKKYMRIKDDAVARLSYDYFAKVFSEPPLTEAKGVAAVLKFLATQPGSAAVKNARPEEFFDNSLLLELQREGYFARFK